MAVIEYKEGEHGGGFIGFRVARTIGTASDYRQEYFSLSDYPRAEARSLANELEDVWKQEAREVLQSKTRNIYMSRPKAGVHIIADGFRASIGIERKVRGGELRTYFVPCFLVKMPGYGKSNITYRIRKLGYKSAYVKAAKKYGDIHNLSTNDRLALIAKEPNKGVFTDYLLKKIRGNGHKLSKKDLLSMLD